MSTYEYDNSVLLNCINAGQQRRHIIIYFFAVSFINVRISCRGTLADCIKI